jgi:hypothetical protein
LGIEVVGLEEALPDSGVTKRFRRAVSVAIQFQTRRIVSAYFRASDHGAR